MNYRKVFLSKGDAENWPTLHDAESGTVLNCWQQTRPDDGGEDPQCHVGCVAFCCAPEKEPGDLVMCLALPRDHVGAPSIIGDLVEAPDEEEEEDDNDAE